VVATLTFTVTGNEPIRCSTLSSSEGVDFVFTRISRINSIVQSAEDVCTISVQSTAEPGDTNARESTLAAASTFSITDTAGNTQTVLSGSPQTIWVQRIAKPVISLSATTETVNLNVAMNGYTVTSSGGTVASYSLTGTLPAGLSFSTTTGRITGTPTVTQTATTYTITATNISGSGTATFTLTVVRTYAVGDTGPGGGIVFYVSAANFTSTGSDCNTTCKYLEAAPTDHATLVPWATGVNVCYAEGSDAAVSICASLAGSFSIYAHPDQNASREAALAIGMGMSNTNQIYARITTAGGSAANTYAAGVAWAYTNNGKTDWHLPSRNELTELYRERVRVGASTERSARSAYSSSTEGSGNAAFSHWFFDNDNNGVFKTAGGAVRPVRAFG
jgi:hypothetical protein